VESENKESKLSIDKYMQNFLLKPLLH